MATTLAYPAAELPDQPKPVILPMILPLFRRARTVPLQPDTISALYGTIVAQARLPGFYRDYGVPDTVEGRFELIVLHLGLFLRRLASDTEVVRELGQRVFDRFCKDMDQNLREMAISDLKVPAEMRRIGAAYYGRARAYKAALTEPGEASLAVAIARNVYGNPSSPDAARLATYISSVAARLAAQDASTLARGELRFPQP